MFDSLKEATMKKRFKVLIICTLILLSTTAVVSAYWTDMLTSKVNLEVAYDAKIKALNVPDSE